MNKKKTTRTINNDNPAWIRNQEPFPLFSGSVFLFDVISGSIQPIKNS